MLAVRERLLEDIQSVLSGISSPSPAPFAPDLSFAELGIDSLGKVELVAELERRHGIMIDDVDYRLLLSPDAVADYLATRLG